MDQSYVFEPGNSGFHSRSAGGEFRNTARRISNCKIFYESSVCLASKVFTLSVYPIRELLKLPVFQTLQCSRHIQASPIKTELLESLSFLKIPLLAMDGMEKPILCFFLQEGLSLLIHSIFFVFPFCIDDAFIIL